MSLAASENFSDIEESLKDWQRKSALIVAVLLVAGIISIGITLFSKPEPTPEEVANSDAKDETPDEEVLEVEESDRR